MDEGTQKPLRTANISRTVRVRRSSEIRQGRRCRKIRIISSVTEEVRKALGGFGGFVHVFGFNGICMRGDLKNSNNSAAPSRCATETIQYSPW